MMHKWTGENCLQGYYLCSNFALNSLNTFVASIICDENKTFRGCFAVSGGSGSRNAACIADEMFTGLRNAICSHLAVNNPQISRQELMTSAKDLCESMCALVVLRGTLTAPYLNDVLRYVCVSIFVKCLYHELPVFFMCEYVNMDICADVHVHVHVYPLQLRPFMYLCVRLDKCAWKTCMYANKSQIFVCIYWCVGMYWICVCVSYAYMDTHNWNICIREYAHVYLLRSCLTGTIYIYILHVFAYIVCMRICR